MLSRFIALAQALLARSGDASSPALQATAAVSVDKAAIETVVGGPGLNNFVVQRNIQRYRELLTSEASETRRWILVKLLAEEEAKLAGVNGEPH